MSTLVGVLREMEGQGIRDGMASAASIWGSSNTSNDRTGNNGKGNSSAAFSSSTTSYGQGSFSFSSFSATAGDSSNSNQSDNNFNSINGNIPLYPNPGFPGLDKTRVNFSSTPLNAPAMENGINAIGNSNINPFHSSSSSGFWSSPNNVFHAPRKSTPLCETSVSRAPFTYAEASTSSQKNTQKSNNVFLSRPRLVKISRRGSNPFNGKFAASTGDLFCTGDGKYSSNVDNSGYNPFRTNSAASLAAQPCNCFVQDLNRGSAPGSFLSGQNVSRTEFKEVPNRRPKFSVVKDFANQREDLDNRFNSWNPFAGASDALKHNGGNTQTADESESGGVNMYLKTPEMGGFTFRTNIEEKLPAREIACNVTSGFTFRANSQEKLAAKENVVSVATGFNFTVNPEEKLAAKKYVSNATSGFTFKPNADEKIAAKENVSNVASSFTFRANPEEKLDVATSYILRAKPEENLAAKENISNVTSGLTSKPNADEKLAAQENVSNVARAFTFRANPQEKQMSNKDEDHVASSFTFKANTGEKLVAKESEGNVASGFTFRANTEAKENVGNVSGGFTFRANTEAKENVGNVSGGFAFRANREVKENVGNVPGGFAFRATTEAKENVGNVAGGFAFRANREGKENAGNVAGGFAFRANREAKENAGNVAGGFAFRANREAKENGGNVPGGFAFRANREAKENGGSVPGGFAFRANTESKENVGNVPGGFAFRANTKEKPGVKKNAGHVTRGGFSVSRRAGRGSKSTIGIVGNEVNLSGSLAADNSQQATEVTKMDSVAGDACSCPNKSTGQEGFNFCASKPRADVDSRHLQDLHSSNSLHSPKNGGGFPFNDSFAAQSSISSSNSLKNSGGCTYDNSFESQDPISSSKSESSKAKSKFALAEGSPIPSTFTFNMVERVESQRKEDAKPCPPVEPFAFSAGSVSFSPVTSCFGGSVKEAINKAPPDALSSVREVGAIPSPVEVPRSEDYLSERNSSWPSMESLSSSLNEMFEFSANKGAGKRYSTGKRREKSQLPASMQRRPGRRHVTKSKRYMPSSTVDSMGHPPNHDEGGSPMDFSPCNEIPSQGAFQFGSHNVPDLGQSSVAYGCPVQSVPFGCHNMSDLGQSSVACDSSLESSGDQIQQNLHESFVMEAKVEELRVAAANLHIGADQEINDVNICQEESSNGGEIWQRAGANQGNSLVFNVCNQWERPHCEEEASAPSSENEWLNSRMEKVRIDDGENTTSAAKPEGSDQSRQFTFVAFPSSSILASTIRQHSRRSHQLRGAENIRGSSSNMKIELPPFSSQPFVQRRVPGPKGDLSQDKATAEISERTSDLPSTTGSFSSLPKQKEEIGTAVSPRAVKSAAAEQACERWRLRGNQAYASGDFPKAEDYYSRGASSVSPNETSQSCVRASMLCYSNRAATRMAVGRTREALADCMRAMAIDPSFLRVQIRAASCRLALGESEAAVRLFKECLRSAKELETQDSKIVTEASEGLRKAQHGWEYTDRAAELLNMTSSADATNALRIVNEALSISPHSERLLELKALALFFLRKYEEVVQVCEQSLDSAERNYCFVNNDSQWGSEDAPGSPDRFSVKLWRWRMIAKSHFHLGRLESALSLLLKYEELNSAAEKSGRQCMESLASLIATIRDLLRHKAAGNEAFQAAKHAEAVEHYTAALACNGESWPFTAVCFCNRAAASQALGNIADAIADCSRAIALDANYPKAISRRATLHEMVRNYGQACNDLRRLIILLERQQQQNKGNQSEKLGSLSTNTHDLRQARERLIKAEEEMKRGNPLDHYLILGVEASCTAAEIKKAYRKAALRHHPDKAGQFLVRSDSGDDGVWKEVGEEVRRDAERLFKMIGEAYAILSDPSKRIRYDTEEEMRKLRTNGNNSGSQTISDAYRHQYEKGGRRQRDRWDSWNGYANLYQRWQSGPDAAQPDTYARRGSNNSKSNEGSRWNEWDDF